MAPTNYQRGRAFEYRTRNKLKDNGAAYVMRAAQSKGQIDLLVLWPMRREPVACAMPAWLVQCKYSIHGGGKLPRSEAEALILLADQVAGIPVLARPGKNGRGVEFINLRTEEAL